MLLLVCQKHSAAVFCACGGSLTTGETPGYITSPGYPQNYPQNIDCVWVITVPNGEAVQLDFEDCSAMPPFQCKDHTEPP
uniref:CUB domain-containing protein n=1 Tax=Periophthalmus magnuspinnatus TaxID=409849 RepID=A0A3B4B219_9GOBI